MGPLQGNSHNFLFWGWANIYLSIGFDGERGGSRHLRYSKVQFRYSVFPSTGYDLRGWGVGGGGSQRWDIFQTSVHWFFRSEGNIAFVLLSTSVFTLPWNVFYTKQASQKLEFLGLLSQLISSPLIKKPLSLHHSKIG